MKNKRENKQESKSNTNFFLDFGDDNDQEEQGAKPDNLVKHDIPPQKEKIEHKLSKKEKKEKRKNLEKPTLNSQGKPDSEILSSRAIKKINKRQKQREQMSQTRKHRINLNQPSEKILARYKEAFPEQNEAKLRDNIRYQKMIFENNKKPEKKRKLDKTAK